MPCSAPRESANPWVPRTLATRENPVETPGAADFSVMRMEDHDLARLGRCLNGVPVLAAPDGTEAARIGLRRGDVVIAVNGVLTPDELAFNYARSLRDDELELEVVRAGTTLRFVLGWETVRRFDPMMLLDEVVASRFDVAF